MEDLLTKESAEFKELIGQLRTAHKSVMAVRDRHRPTIADERYLKGEEVMEYLHISPRTLQTLRDNRMIGFVTIGGKILYPNGRYKKSCSTTIIPVKPPF